VLRFAHEHHELLQWSDNLRLLEVMATVNTEYEHMANCLREHYLTFRHRAHRLQLAERQLAYIDQALEQKLNEVSEIYLKVLGAER
jgi:glutamate-ammonia-ligase adenylyltransferase